MMDATSILLSPLLDGMEDVNGVSGKWREPVKLGLAIFDP